MLGVAVLTGDHNRKEVRLDVNKIEKIARIVINCATLILDALKGKPEKKKKG